MGLAGFKELFTRLRTGDESVEIEAKRGSDAGKSLLETVCAFANEPQQGGGYILLGVTVEEDALLPEYEVVGVDKPDQLQADIASQCRELFSTPIRPDISVEQHDGKNVLVVYVPEATPHDKPVYIKSKGIHKGSFRRIGSSDQTCTDDDLAVFYQARGQRSFDDSPLPDTTLDDIDEGALAEYRRLRAHNTVENELLTYQDEDLLFALGAISRNGERPCLTLAGLVVFGKPTALRRHLPMTRVDYIRVEGREWVPDPDKRYHAIEKLGPLILTIPSLVAQVLDDIPKAFSLAEDGVHRKDVPLVPRKVIREAIVNALMHRNYQKHQPVQIIRYANRIEIKNPGYSLVPEERLGEPGSITRNPKIAAVLHDIGLAETKGTGIRAMREAMERANLTLPLFESDRARDEFTVRLLVHHLLTPQDWDWLGRFRDCNLDEDDARALIIVREIGAIDNAMYRSATHLDALTASGHLRKLRDHGLLEKKGSGPATYYVPTTALLRHQAETKGEPADTLTVSSPNPAGTSLPSELNPPTKGLVAGLNPATKAEQLGIGPLPPPLAQSILELGDRADPMALRQVIVELCRWKALQPSHLAGLLNRGPKYLRSKCLRPMILSGELEYLHPTNPAHPKQAYRATSIREEKEDARENN